MLFSVGGAIDAPEMHQHAIDNMLKQLVLGGMPLEIANDILGSDDNWRYTVLGIKYLILHLFYYHCQSIARTQSTSGQHDITHPNYSNPIKRLLRAHGR